MDGLETYGGQAKYLWETEADIPFFSLLPAVGVGRADRSLSGNGFLSLKGEFADKTQYRERWTLNYPYLSLNSFSIASRKLPLLSKAPVCLSVLWK